MKFVLETLQSRIPWIKGEIQDIGLKFGMDSCNDFVLGFQLELLDKFKKEYPEISDSSQLILHLVQEILNFDSMVFTNFGVERSLLSMMVEDDVFLEIWCNYKLQGKY